jgi:hypothetical protein
MDGVLDHLARPRIGVVLPVEPDARIAATAARTLVLALLRRLPRTRIEVLTVGAPPPASPLDCGRPPRRLAAGGADRRRLDLLLAAGGAKVPGRTTGAAACPVAQLPGTLLDVALLAAAAAAGELHRNRVDTLRLLGWLPPAGTAHRVTTLPDAAGVDEVVAAVASATEYGGDDPLLTAIAAGAGIPHSAAYDDAPVKLAALQAAVDDAAAAALDCWRHRGSPGAAPDPTPARRAAAESAALRVELRLGEREAEAIRERLDTVETQLRQVTGSRTWRYTETAREAYHAARRRLQR